MTIFSKMMVASWAIFILSVVVGYVVCHFIITPILLKKHRNKSIAQGGSCAHWGQVLQNNLFALQPDGKKYNVAVAAMAWKAIGEASKLLRSATK